MGGQFIDLVFAMREGEIKLCPHRVKKHSKTEQLQHDRTTTLSVCGEPVTMTKHRPVEEHSLCKRAIAKHLGGYSWLITEAAARAGVAFAGFTPHSPRAGFCTDAVVGGCALPEVAAVTRHMSLKSLRGYVDATSVTAGYLAERLSPLLPRAAAAQRNMLGHLRTYLAG